MSTPSALSAPSDSEIGRALGLDRGRRGRRWLWRGLWLAAGVAAVAGVALRMRSSAPAGPAYETHAATRRDLQVAVTASGTLEPSTTVDIAPEISGRVRAVHVDYNDRVARGQVLVELDTDLLRAQLAQADSQVGVGAATLEQTRASDTEAQVNLRRARALAAQRLLSDADLDGAVAAARRASAAAAAAAAQLRAAQAAQTVARTSLDKATIQSPIDGVVLVRSVDAGQTVVAALQAPVLLLLAEDLGRMRLVVDVDEADVSHVAAGFAATFTVAAYPDRVFHAGVVSVRNGAQVRESVVTYQTVLDVDNREGLLRPGMTGTAQISAEAVKAALTVPNAALRFEPRRPAAEERSAGGRRVWVLRDGKAVPVAVEAGPTDGIATVIRSGKLDEGDAVIVGENEP